MYEMFYEQLKQLAVVPCVVLERVEDALPLADALVLGGMPSAEVTFRTPAAANCIAEIAVKCPSICVGAGTVLTVEQCDRAIDAGAKFIVSPGYSEKVVRRCIELGVPVLPGTVTPSEVTAAVNLGLKVTEFFPAEQYGGIRAIKAMCAPFIGHRFMPTGGINLDNLEDYLVYKGVIACGGTWMVQPDLFADGDFSAVQGECEKAMERVREIRSQIRS